MDSVASPFFTIGFCSVIGKSVLSYLKLNGNGAVACSVLALYAFFCRLTSSYVFNTQVKVTIAGLESTEPVKCSREVMIVPDTALSDVAQEQYHLVVIPGGDGGATRIAQVCSLT